MTRKNKGFTLIELLVVITILLILTTGSLTLTNRLQYANTKKAASKIDTLLSQLRLETMSKKDKPYLYLYNLEDTIYYKVSLNEAETVLDKDSGNKLSHGVAIYYKTSAGDETSLENNEKICINFDRSSGAFSSDFAYIIFKNGSDENKITCIQETGRHWVD